MRKVGMAVAWVVLVTGAVVMGQTDRFEGMDSHDVPHCSPRGSATSAQCRCLGMVNEVQTTRAAKCWKDAGFDNPEDIPDELELYAPEAVKACLAAVPDHCEVVRETPTWWGYKGPNTCRTSCKPERCGCADSACKAHGQQ